MQIKFNLPEINRKETRDQVESALEKYQIMLLMDPESYEPKITASFSLSSSAPTNEFKSSTEDTAIKRTESERVKNNYVNKIKNAVNRLNYQERTVIIKRYITEDDVYDYEVYNDLGYSERKYYRIKASAFYKLAFILKIAIYNEKEGDAS